MSKKEQTADAQPSDLVELEKLTNEFMNKFRTIENEIKTLQEDRKELIAEYKGKLNMKSLKAAMQVVKIESRVSHKHDFDCFLEVLHKDV